MMLLGATSSSRRHRQGDGVGVYLVWQLRKRKEGVSRHVQREEVRVPLMPLREEEEGKGEAAVVVVARGGCRPFVVVVVLALIACRGSPRPALSPAAAAAAATTGSMSDNDDIEVESDADKRAHHNALERKRRDHIKDSFHSLRDSVPSLQGEKQQASRAQILDKATEYIQYMRRKNHTHQQDIDDLKRQNALLEQQVRALEKARSSAQLQANYSSSDNSLYTNPKGSTISAFDGGSDSSSESELEEPQSRKKLRMEAS